MLALVVVAGAVGYALGRAGDSDAEAASLYLDDEYTFVGAARSWPRSPNASITDPFTGVEDARLVELGRTVCVRAADPDMDFDGMLHLLALDPHQTFVIITEAIDKLCPSRQPQLDDLTS